MINKILLSVVIFLMPVTLISFFNRETNFILNNEEKILDDEIVNIRLFLKSDNKIVNINLEDYIVGVVAAEMPASFDIEALKAQAIAARSYAMTKINNNREYDLVNTTSDQAYISVNQMKDKWGKSFNKYYNKIVLAVNETKSKVIKYNDEIIRSYYFALSNGYTESSELVFNEKSNYLNVVPSLWDKDIISKYERTKKITKNKFCELLGITNENIIISNKILTDSNRVDSIKINNILFTGNQLRKKLSLRSSDFDIEVSDDEVIITTRGYGHGVGMSQYGANALAKLGYDYEYIINYFYQNTNISKI